MNSIRKQLAICECDATNLQCFMGRNTSNCSQIDSKAAATARGALANINATDIRVD